MYIEGQDVRAREAEYEKWKKSPYWACGGMFVSSALFAVAPLLALAVLVVSIVAYIALMGYVEVLFRRYMSEKDADFDAYMSREYGDFWDRVKS